MLMHPDVWLTMANDRHRELIEESAKHRLLTAAREARKARKAGRAATARSRPAGTLTSCEPSAVVPAR